MSRKKPKFKMKVGDCIQKMREHLDDGSVDLFFTDPPFNIQWGGYDSYEDDLPEEKYIHWCRHWLQWIYRKLHKHGSFWLYIGDEFVSELDVQAKRCGFYKRSHVIHYYTFGVHCARNFARSHSHLLYYTKRKSGFTFNAKSKAVRVPSARQLVYNDKRANPAGRLPDNTWVLNPLDFENLFTETEDTWLESRVCGTFHERRQRGEYQKKKVCPQMPVRIVERAVLTCSNVGDLVADCFLGTGTTAEAALKHGRNFWGCDISQEYVNEARKRAREATG